MMDKERRRALGALTHELGMGWISRCWMWR